MERSSLIGVVAALVLSMAVSPDARASCNSIPDAESAVASAAPGVTVYSPLIEGPSPGTEIDEIHPPDVKRRPIGFKSALGRVDRIHLIPGRTKGFRIQPDGQCVDASNGRLTLRKVPDPRIVEDRSRDRGALDERDEFADSNYVASLLTRSESGGGIQAMVLASESICGAPGAPMGFRAEEFEEYGVTAHCEPLAPTFVTPPDGPSHVAVRLPTERGEFFRPVRRELHRPATVVLTKGMPHPALLRDVARDGCAARCGDLIEAGASGCVDKFYAALSNPTVVPDPIPCDMGIVSAKKNVFKALCEDKEQLPADLAECTLDPTGTLQFWEDSCGGIHIPFDWTEIRKQNGTPITRWVAGRSATSRVQLGNLDNEKRIWIPGREFLGSTPWDDASGTYASTNWRKPEINPWYPKDPSGNDVSPREAGLRGTVDKNDSIVHVYPRMPVYRVCKVGADYEGCMKVGDSGAIQCACSDRYDPANCSCETLVSPMYFQCDGGDFEGMPCTRHEHCDSVSGNSGNCSQKPSCQPKSPNRVWGGPWNGTTPQLPPGTGDCWNDGDCPGNQTCGYPLFDFPGGGTLITLDLEIPHGSGKQGRGACQGPPRDENCHSNKECPSGKGNCRGFTLQAQEKVP